MGYNRAKVALVNLGCPKNQVDAETMLGLIQAQGYRLTTDLEQAEIIVVNTCGFIDKAREESVEQILAAAQHKVHSKCTKLVVAGCLAQRYYDDLAAELPEVDAFLGTGNVDQISQVLEGNTLLTDPNRYTGVAEQQRLYSTFPYGYLKIAEGCNNHCSYCVIPQLRGRLRSKDMGQVRSEAERMVAAGLKEIILIAQDTAQYGIDFSGRSQLPVLLRMLEKIDEDLWIRLLYCYPDHIDEELLNVLATSNSVIPYLDLPLQHSHFSILKSMGRGRGRSLSRLIEFLRNNVPNIALRTTFIVGYPGETEEHFQHLLDFIRWAKFDHLGAFMYSREEGTRAAELKGQVSLETKARRYHELMQTQQDIVFQRNSDLVGKTGQGLVDYIEQGQAVVRSYRQAPEIDSVILAEANDCKPGDFVQYKCTGYDGYDLLGGIENVE